MDVTIACHCGNPIGSNKCCKIKINSKPWSSVPKKVTVQQACLMLKQAVQQNQPAIIQKISTAILSKVPNQPTVFYLLGLEALMASQVSQAQQLMQTAFNNGLIDPAAHYNFANVLAQQNQLAEAIGHIDSALAIKPDFAEALKIGCQISTKIQSFTLAIDYSQKLLQYFPQNLNHFALLAETYHASLMDEQALEIINKGLAIAANDQALLLLQATIFEMQNRLDEANEVVKQLPASGHLTIAIQTLKAKLLYRTKQHSKAQAQLSSLLENHTCNAVQQQAILSILVKVYQAQKHYWDAWQSAQKMNTLSKSIQLPVGTFTQIKDYFTAVEKGFSKLIEYGVQIPEAKLKDASGSQWLYIVGFPRVGSTMLEKLLFQYFDCDDMGESAAMPAVEKSIYEQTGRAWWQLSSAQWTQLETKISLTNAVATYREQGWTEGRALIDKNLLNSSRLILLSQLLPHAPIIKLVRHPVDILVSCFTNSFGSNDAWHTDLELIARYMLKIDEHWHFISEKINNPIYIMRYENLVTETWPHHQLMTFLSKAWSARPRVQHNNTTPNFVTRTASYAQVKQKINRDSINNYQYYLDYIPPNIIEIIRPIAERWDYTI